MWARFPPRWLFLYDGLQPQICLQLILSSDATTRRRRRAGSHQRMLLNAHWSRPGARPDNPSNAMHTHVPLLAIASSYCVSTECRFGPFPRPSVRQGAQAPLAPEDERLRIVDRKRSRISWISDLSLCSLPWLPFLCASFLRPYITTQSLSLLLPPPPAAVGGTPCL